MSINTPKPEEPNPTGSIGRYMIIIMWLLILGVMYLGFSKWLANQQNPNQSFPTLINADGSKQIVLKRNKNGHYVITGMINNQNVVFYIDTGATYVAIPQKLAAQLGLVKGIEMMMRTANGEVKANYTRIGTLSLGNILFKDVKAIIAPNMEEDDILLGMTVLKNLKFTQEGDELILRSLN